MQVRAKRKSSREAQHPGITPLVVVLLLSLREGKLSNEEKAEFGPLLTCYAMKVSWVLPVIRGLITNVI